MVDVTLGLAFLAGLLSFISPCVLPLVPAYIGYMGGRMTQQVAAAEKGKRDTASAFQQRFGTLTHGVFFVAGFTLFFVIFGLLTTAAVSALTRFGATESDVTLGIARLGGTVVIFFGLHIMGVLNRVFMWLMTQAAKLDQTRYGTAISVVIGLALVSFIYWVFVQSWFFTLLTLLLLIWVFRAALKTGSPGQFWITILTTLQTALYIDTRRQGQQPQNQRFGYLGSMFMGVVFSAGWTPCIGPIYGSILIASSSGDNSASETAVFLTAYSLGLGIPFLLTALALDQSQAILRRLQRNMRTIELISGAFLVLLGVLILTQQMERLSQYGNQGELGDLSLNIEKCVVGWAEGRIQGGNVIDCLGDGPKEDFWTTVDKEPVAVVAENLVASDAAPPGDTAANSAAGLEVPDLGASSDPAGSELAAPELAASTSTPVPTVVVLSSRPVEGLQNGQSAPDFSVELLSGDTVSLSDYQGKVVLVNFWATWCGPCRDEMPDFQTIYDLYGGDFVVLAVNYQEDRAAVQAFVDEFSLTFPIALDEDATINEDLYGEAIHQRYPTSILVDRDGVIRDQFSGTLAGSDLIAKIDALLDT